MLVLDRKMNESVVINDNIFIKIVQGRMGNVKVVIDAPKEIPVVRGELHPDIEEAEKRWERAQTGNKKVRAR